LLNRWWRPWPIDWPIEEWVLLVITGGIAVRVLWLAGGFWGLARLRSRSAPAPDALAAVLDDAQGQFGVRAEFRTSERASAPITFGLRRPLILLPTNIGAMESDTQRAIACHELLHVRRCDWPWCVAEEFERSVLWFHPAVW
jgi:beta-lactamase regulating signal transducer with metallopeptidase domain